MMILIPAILTIVGIVHGLYALLHVSIQPNQYIYALSEPTASILYYDQIIRFSQISLTLFMLTFFFLVWLYMAKRNVIALLDKVEHNLLNSTKQFAMLVGGILFALRMMLQLWDKSIPENHKAQSSKYLVITWWFFLIVANVCKIIGVWHLLKAQTLAEWMSVYPWMLAAYTLYFALYLMTLKLIRRLSYFQSILAFQTYDHVNDCLMPIGGREETQDKKIGPYSLGEGMRLLVRNLLGPSQYNPAKQHFISKSYCMNDITPEFSLGLGGDVMMMFGHDWKIDESLKAFYQECDAVLLNMEGVITDQPKKGPDQKHHVDIIKQLGQLCSPSKMWLSFANNHSADFGEVACRASYAQFQMAGFHCFGLKDQPCIELHEKLRVITATQWSNKPSDYLFWLDQTPEQYIQQGTFNLFFPHWGYEMECYPRLQATAQMQMWLSQFDAVVGHHSHTPQPISVFKQESSNVQQLGAYSLGDFCFGLGKKNFPGLKHYPYGLALKIQIGPLKENPEKWAVGQVEWSFIDCDEQENHTYISKCVENIPYFKALI